MTNNNLNTVKSIGRGVRLVEKSVEQIVATLPEGFDHKARGAVSAAVHSWACPDGNVPPVAIGSGDNQRRTDYGIGVNTLVTAVKRALATPAESGPVLRAALSGEGGGSTVIPEDHPLYAALVALIKGDASDSE